VRKIAVCNQKGGVGKTATAINLTAGLSLAERNTILIDFDPQANSSSGLGIDYRTVKTSVYHVLADPQRIRSAVVKTAWPFLSVLPATPDLVGAEIELVDEPAREKKLQTALRVIDDDYAFAIIDCPPSLGLLTLNGLVAADSVIIPIQCEYYALEGLEKLLRTIRTVKEHFHPDLAIEGILLTMFDARLNLARDVVEDIRQHFPDQVFETLIPRSVRIAESPSHGRSVIHYSIASAGAQAYLNLTKELLNHD